MPDTPATGEAALGLDLDAPKKRDWLFLGCRYGEHTWEHIGGCGCNCPWPACCSVPVYECAICGACDYGDNAEADDIQARCEVS